MSSGEIAFKYYFLLILLNFSNIIVQVELKVYTSMVEIETLFKVEKNLKPLFNLYLEAEEKRLQYLKENLHNFPESKFSNFNDVENFVASPINVYHLIKRFTTDLKQLFDSMTATKLEDLGKTTSYIGRNIKFPDAEDIPNIAAGFERLRLFYNLSISDISNNRIIPGLHFDLKLSAKDCLNISVALFEENQFYSSAVEWLEECLNIESKEVNKTIRRIDLLDPLIYCHYKNEDYSLAIQAADEFLKIDPNNQRIKTGKQKFTEFLQLNKTNKISTLNETELQNVRSLLRNLINLCSNTLTRDFKKEMHYKCYLSSNLSPYLLLQPTKVEILHLKPDVLLYHDVMRDREINTIKSLVINNLTRSHIVDTDGKGIESPIRVSEVNWLLDYIHPTVANLSKRLEEITGLDVRTGSEPLQVNNYGFGGHYGPHSDYLETNDLPGGNRMATVLLYFNNVIAGGATVFTNLNISVFPEKGSAIFWFNAYKNGEEDNLTIHSACPVLGGSKWVANKWIRIDSQMFKKPCGLKENDRYFRAV